jgi:hypothetical protein
VPTATTTASALRVRIGRLLDPRLQRHTSTRVTRPVQSVPPQAAVHTFAGTHKTLDIPPTVRLDSRIIAADVNALEHAVPLPPVGIVSAAAHGAPPWDAISASTVSAAIGAERAAVATAAHARSAGVSIGRFFTRAGKAVAKDFQPY